jgi:hypothetical protein
VQGVRGRLIKKNPKIQCLAIELLVHLVRNCPGTVHECVATEEFMGVLAKLVKVPGLSPIVSYFITSIRFETGF